MPKISIVIPVRNRVDLVGRAIDSVLGQSFDDFELLVSDNCSDDGTDDLVESYLVRDKRVKLFRQSQNIGMWNNFNFLIEQASGEYLKVLCSDDFLLPLALETEMILFRGWAEATLVMGGGLVKGGNLLNRKRVGWILREGHYDINVSAREFLRLMSSCGVNIFNYPAGVLVRRTDDRSFPRFKSELGDIADIYWFLENISFGGMVIGHHEANYVEFGQHQQGVKALMSPNKKYSEFMALASYIQRDFGQGKEMISRSELVRVNRFYELKENLAQLWHGDIGSSVRAVLGFARLSTFFGERLIVDLMTRTQGGISPKSRS